MRYSSQHWLAAKLVLLLLVMSLVPLVSFADDACPNSGEHAATKADIPLMQAAGIPNPVVGMCWNPDNRYVGSAAAEAKQYLMSLPKQDLSGCAPPSDPQNIQRLNPSFAVCAARFLRAYTAAYGNNIIITSAFRDGTPGSSPRGGTESANQCAGGAVNSNHQRGFAMDMYPRNGDWRTLWNFASANPQFGVCFPYQDGRLSGYRDEPHLGFAGTGGREAQLCAGQGVANPCVPIVYDDASTADFPTVTNGTYTTPTAPGIFDTMREILSPIVITDPSQSTTTNIYSFLSDIFSSDIFSSLPALGSNNTGQNQQNNNSLLSHLGNNNSGQGTSSTVTITGSSSPTYSYNGTPSSYLPFDIVEHRNDIVTLADASHGSGANNSLPIVTLYDDGSPYTRPATETFVSPEFYGTTEVASSSPITLNAYQKILSDMQTAVLGILNFLNPFKPVPVQQLAD